MFLAIGCQTRAGLVWYSHAEGDAVRAIVLTAPGAVEAVDDWAEPRPGPREVVVAMRGVGLCGSDLGVYSGERATPSLPWVMGHEGGGEIVAVGERVTDREIGQRVVVEPNYCCLACAHCRRGRTSSCPARRIVGISDPGLLAERVAVPARFAWPVPATFSDRTTACIEPLAVARSAVRRSGVAASDSCLVVGAGSQGLLACLALLAIGVHPHVVEPHAGRRALAAELGATITDPDELGGFTYVFETAGVPAAWDTALSAVAPAGTVVMIGIGHEAVAVSIADLVRRQLGLRGMLIYDHPRDFAETVAAIERGDIDPERVFGAVHHPDQAAEAFARAPAVAGKTWIDLSIWQRDSL
jgi:alcohol dehydrogenase/L-iditol 2-dehydrogenase